MKIRLLSKSVVLAVAIAMVSCANQGSNGESQRGSSRPNPTSLPSKETAKQHGQDHSTGRVPKFQTDAASLNNLSPTLDPEQFTGKTREAYLAVMQIPKTIAQLPCYCFCDDGHGHKSLHSCYEDTHATQCAVCVDEALMAYYLEKEQKLKPEQIRERIIAQYGQQQ